MEDKYSEVRNKVFIAIVALYILMTIGINIFFYLTCTGRLQLSVSALDGIVSFMIDNKNVIGTETMVLSFLLFYRINPNLNNEYICLQKSRKDIYYQHIKQSFYLNCIFTLGNAFISFMTTLILSKSISNWDKSTSIYYLLFDKPFEGNFFVVEMYMVLSVAACICIVQVYLMFYLLIYWLIKSRNFTFVCGIVISWCLGRNIFPEHLKLTSNTIYAVHYMMGEPQIIVYGLLKYSVFMLVVFALTNVVLRGRDLL